MVLLLSLSGILSAQGPTRVAAVAFGSGTSFGQAPEFFPANVLGPIAGPADVFTAVADPQRVVSLGRGGWLILEFDPPISNVAGPDFAVFENAFVIDDGSGDVFDEWLRVEVANDTTDWRAFSVDTVSGAGFAGRTPTGPLGSNYTDPAQAGGDPFDLAEVALPSARYVRLSDATAFQNDPIKQAAEVDGIARFDGVSSITNRAQVGLYSAARVWVASGRIYWQALPGEFLPVQDALGRPVASLPTPGPSGVALLPALAAGVYWVRPADASGLAFSFIVP